ncbi:MAG: dihydroorotase [Peptoniphilaceae bacterium]
MIIKNARVIDPISKIDEIIDIKIKDGLIEGLGNFNCQNEETIDAKGLIAAPGFVDIHVHFRDPGFTYKEDLITGSQSASAGGYTSVVCMANTDPVMDEEAVLRDFISRAKNLDINVYTLAALTKDLQGQELVDMEKLVEIGALGFSDDGIPNTNTSIILEAMNRAKKLDVPISFHEEDPKLNKENGVNHGKVSKKMGVYGAPSISEDVLVARDGALALETGAKVDIQHISSARAIDLVKFYKSQGANLFAEVTPHHFSSTEDLILEKGTLAKMNPPLRSEKDRERIIKALKENTISIIATDHAPHSKSEKNQEFSKAPSGIIGLETAFALGMTNLVKKGKLSLSELLEKMSANPAKLYKLKAGQLKTGYPADIVIFDEKEEFLVDKFKSKSQNSPYIGEKLQGKIKYTICRGKIVYSDK